MKENNIKLINAKCTNCGAVIEINEATKESGALVCPACDTAFVTENAIEFAAIKNQQAEKINNLRKMLHDAVRVNNIKGIKLAAENILEIIPRDYSAKYYYAYAMNMLGNYKYIEDFYKNSPQNSTDEEIERLLPHIIAHSDLRDRFHVESYIMALEGIDNNYYLDLYKKEFARRKEIEEHYDDVPRDVFICYRSINSDIAMKVLNVLEQDGNKCWISARNLRPGDTENYWNNIRKAIKSCSLFLVISSEDAMLSNDVKNEMNIAKELNKPRLEYKIDNRPHTTFFKHFFDGHMWVDGSSGDEKSLYELCYRVYRELQKNTNITHFESVENYRKNANTRSWSSSKEEDDFYNDLIRKYNNKNQAQDDFYADIIQNQKNKPEVEPQSFRNPPPSSTRNAASGPSVSVKTNNKTDRKSWDNALIYNSQLKIFISLILMAISFFLLIMTSIFHGKTIGNYFFFAIVCIITIINVIKAKKDTFKSVKSMKRASTFNLIIALLLFLSTFAAVVEFRT